MTVARQEGSEPRWMSSAVQLPSLPASQKGHRPLHFGSEQKQPKTRNSCRHETPQLARTYQSHFLNQMAARAAMVRLIFENLPKIQKRALHFKAHLI